MIVQCTCGKQVTLDSTGKGVCGNCGYTFAGAGATPKSQELPQHNLERKPRNKRKVYVTKKIEKKPVKSKRPITSRISARIKLAIRGEEDKGGCLGCSVVLLLVITAVFAVDLFLVNPAKQLPCSHTGHDSILFGLLPFGHSCTGTAALTYIKNARIKIEEATTPVENFSQIIELTGVAALEMPFEFEYYPDDNEFLILAKDEGAISYFVDSEGTVHYDSTDDVDVNSPIAGSLE